MHGFCSKKIQAHHAFPDPIQTLQLLVFFHSTPKLAQSLRIQILCRSSSFAIIACLQRVVARHELFRFELDPRLNISSILGQIGLQV